MKLRHLLRGGTVALWALFGLLAAHRSRFATVFDRYSPEYATLLVLILLLAAAATGAHWPPLTGRLRRARHPLVLMLCSSVLALALLEALVRGLNLFGASFYQELTRYQLTLLPDPVLLYTQPPGHRADYQGVDVAINHLGLRERPLAAKTADRLRILVLGDSVTFGWGVRIEDTFPRRLESELEARLGRAVETINSGVPGYNTTIEAAFLARHGPELRPDLVVLVYVENDIEVARPLPRDFGRRPRLLEDPLGLAEYFMRKLWLYRLAYHLGPLIVPSGKPRESDRSEAEQASLDSLSDAAAWCRGRGIPFSVFLYRPVPLPLTDRLRGELETVATRDGWLFVDMLPWFAGHPLRTVINSFVDIHPNARGHEIIARGMAQALVDSAVVRPPGVAPRGGESR